MNKGVVIGTGAVAAVATGVALLVLAPGPGPMVQLSWTPNYTASNEVTLIKSSTNLLTPWTNWTVRFAGAASNCLLPRNQPQEFFIAENVLTN